MADLTGRRVAVLATDGVEQVELTQPVAALRAAGAEVVVVSPKSGAIQGMNHHDFGDKLRVDAELSAADPENFDALLLPGGVANPDTLRADDRAVTFVKHFVDAEKPIAAICHGPWTLIEAGAVRGRTLTSWPSLRTDLRNAGANWVDETCVVDGPLVTARKPDDIPAFNQNMLAVFAAGSSGRRGSSAVRQ